MTSEEPMLEPGHFILYDAAVPDLPAGDYVLDVEHRIDVPGEPSDPIPAKATHLKVTAPRYVMPPDQILSTFPPNQAEGAFETRLPQIVLRRRTLPWERPHTSQPDDVPWLALVLIADGEGELRPNTPISQCVTLGVTLTGDRDAETGTALRVTESVVEKVFPGRDEVSLLTHVRQVDLSDTELSLGDDDGWMAVVIANRLPQPGVRYRACLISLEGQLGLLPLGADAQAAPDIQATYVYPKLGAALQKGQVEAALALANKDLEISPQPRRPGRATGHTKKDAWSDAPATSPRSARPAFTKYVKLPPLQLAGIELEQLHPAEMIRVFPVLAHWTFTCSESGDFQARMQNLDVGLLGTRAPEAP
ncbi:MAG: hypothetical protein OEW31_00600, partial [Thermoleophilia bacterium]|nr:hypothetical protein [Thermoleophilia bacterium]